MCADVSFATPLLLVFVSENRLVGDYWNTSTAATFELVFPSNRFVPHFWTCAHC
jgi:hypothetical protein